MVDPGSARRPAAPAGAHVVSAVAVGGVLGSLARYQIGRWWPTPADGFPSATLLINLTGCLVIGAFLVLITEHATPHRLVRPFVGTGVLGGFTTFSTYALDIRQLWAHDRVGTAMVYLVATALGALAAAAAGMAATRRILAARATRAGR